MSASQLKAVATGQAEQQRVADMKPKEKISYMLEKRKGEIQKMLPKHLSADRLLKVAQIAATTTPGLAECDIPSLVGAIGQCAQMGLEPNTVLGHAYLVPFNTKRKDAAGNERWVKSVQVIVGYKGLIDLARRSGQIVSIAAHEVCKNDKFDLVYGLDEKLEHRPSMDERGDTIGFYAVAKLVGGGHAFEFMSVHQVHAIRDSSQGYQQAKKYKKEAAHPWGAHFIEMGRKTVIRRLAKFLPLSIEFQTATVLDEMASQDRDQRLDENTIDGDFIFAQGGDEHGDQNEGREPEQIGYDPAPVLGSIAAAMSIEALDLIGDQLRDAPDEHYDALSAAFNARRAQFQPE
jgi:recombination protein RecT